MFVPSRKVPKTIYVYKLKRKQPHKNASTAYPILGTNRNVGKKTDILYNVSWYPVQHKQLQKIFSPFPKAAAYITGCSRWPCKEFLSILDLKHFKICCSRSEYEELNLPVPDVSSGVITLGSL